MGQCFSKDEPKTEIQAHLSNLASSAEYYPTSTSKPASQDAHNYATPKIQLMWGLLEHTIKEENFKELQKDWKQNFEMILVNCLVQSVQFQKNYDRDRTHVASMAREEEQRFNKVLHKNKMNLFVNNYQFKEMFDNVGIKSDIYPDILEPLLPTQYFITYDSVDVNRHEEFTQIQSGSQVYTPIEEPVYRVCLQSQKKNSSKGFFLLRHVENSKRNSIEKPDENESANRRKGTLRRQQDVSKESGLQTESLEEDKYGYAMPIECQIGGETSDSKYSELPSNCFRLVNFRKKTKDNSYEISNDHYGTSEMRSYLVSSSFGRRFADSAYTILREVGFQGVSERDIYTAPKMVCRNSTKFKEVIKEEVSAFFPCIESRFIPNEVSEWIYRNDRKTFKHVKTNVDYQWPTPTLISKCKETGCVFLPIGYIPLQKKGLSDRVRTSFELEWQVSFPKSDHILLRSLNHPKLRCYLFAQLLAKKYLDPKCITDEHIRHLLFNMIEENPGMGSEEQLGQMLLTFMQNLKKSLADKVLPNFYNKSHNLFENVRESKLLFAQEKVTRIIENFVVYLLNAINDLEYKDSFYPKINTKRIYKILRTKSPLLLNGELKSGQKRAPENSERLSIDSKFPRAEDKYQRKMQGVKAREILEEQQRVVVQTQRSHFDLDKVLNFEEVDGPKKKLILEEFIKFFFQMVQESRKFRATGQATMYLMQAEILCQLYQDELYDDRDFRTKLAGLKEIQSPADFKEYWQCNFGDDENIFCEVSTGERRLAKSSSFQERNRTNLIPLPEVPSPLTPRSEDKTGDKINGRSVLRTQLKSEVSIFVEEYKNDEMNIEEEDEGLEDVETTKM